MGQKVLDCGMGGVSGYQGDEAQEMPGPGAEKGHVPPFGAPHDPEQFPETGWGWLGKRRYPRWPVREGFPLKLHLALAGRRSLEGQVENVSLGGLGVQFPADAPVRLDDTVEGDLWWETTRIKVEMRVVRVPGAPVGFAGLEFIDLGGGKWKWLETYLASAWPEPADG